VGGEMSEGVKRGTADAPAGLISVAVGVLSFEQKGNARRFYAPAPEIRTDQIGRLPIRPCLEQHNFLAGLRQHGSKDRTGRAGTDDHDIALLAPRHLTPSSSTRSSPST